MRVSFVGSGEEATYACAGGPDADTGFGECAVTLGGALFPPAGAVTRLARVQLLVFMLACTLVC